MRSENGIPRPWQPNNLAQKVEDLKRKVEELEARRNFVSLERIVEGGTIDANVGTQLTETVKREIVIDGGNLGEGALDGQRIEGARIVGGSIVQEANGYRTSLISDSFWGGKIQFDVPGQAGPGVILTQDDGSLTLRPPKVLDANGVAKGTVTVAGQGSGSIADFRTRPDAGGSLAVYGPVSGRGQLSVGGVFRPDGTSQGGGLYIFANGADYAGDTVYNPDTTDIVFNGPGMVRTSSSHPLTLKTASTINLVAPQGVQINGKALGAIEPDPLVLTSLTGSDQPTKANDDVAINWTGASGDTSLWGYNYSPRYPTRLYAQKAGIYFLTGNVTFSNMGSGMRGVWFRKNGTKRIRGQSNPPPSADQYAEIDAHNYEVMAPGDYIEVMATVAGAAGAVSVKANEGTTGGIEWKRPA